MSGAPLEVNEAYRWCESFTRSHYENFTVAGFFLPAEKRREYYALYAFSRTADDIADEVKRDESAENRIDRLEDLGRKLDDLASGKESDHPLFIALGDLVQRHNLETSLLHLLIDAFIQDQIVNRYDTWKEVEQYASGSANPVGRIVLRLHGYHDPWLDLLSDQICTGLQLANFIQDIYTDLRDRDRIYIPREDLHRFGVSESMILHHPDSGAIRKLIRFEVKRTEELLRQGSYLINTVKPSLRRQLILFHGGGRAALHAVRKKGYTVSEKRPEVSRCVKFALFTRALRGKPI